MLPSNKPEKEIETSLARRRSYRMSFSYSTVFLTQIRPTETVSDEMLAKQAKSDLLSFLSLTNNSWLNDALVHPQNRLEVVLDFFPKLHEAARSGTLKLPIPDTLCLRDNSSLHIYSESNTETVRFREGVAAVNSFVQRLEEQGEGLSPSVIGESYPRAIVLDEVGGHKVCLSTEEIPRRWFEAKSRYKLIQQFVVPKSKEIVKYRIVWVKDRQPLIYIITRLGTHAVSRQSDSRRYLHDINTFSYAGRLFRSSFSPFFPYSSNLQESLLEKQSSISRQSTKKSLIIRTRPKSKFSLVQAHKRIPHLEGMASVVCDILRSKVLHSLEDIRLLVFDVSQGIDGVYRLLNVKGVLCWMKPEGELMEEVQAFGRRRKTEEVRREGGLGRNKPKEWLHVLQRESTVPKTRKRCPFVDLKEANERKVAIYSQLPKLEIETDKLPPKQPKSRLRVYCSELIAETARLYDRMRTSSSTKRGGLEKQELPFLTYPHFVDSIVDKTHHRLSESTLSYFFKGKDMSAMKTGVIKAISAQEGYTFRFRVRKIHQAMSISTKEFESYLTAVSQQLREDGVPEVDITCAVSRLAQYQGDIVEPDSPGPMRTLKKH